MSTEPASSHAFSEVYTPPLTAGAAPSTAKTPRRRHVALLGLSVVAFAFTFATILVLPTFASPRRLGGLETVIGAVGFAVSAILALVGASSAVGDIVRPSSNQRGGLAIARNIVSLVGNLAMVAVGALAAFFFTFGFGRGRQIRRFGRPLLPRIVRGRSWAHTKVSVAAPSEIPKGVAAQWRENGRTEHASVAAFARLTLDLMALGAPPHLIAASHADAVDEIRHAELCFSLASSIDGDKKDPGRFPQGRRARILPPTRALGLATLALDSLIEGALLEGVSARIVAKLAKRSDVPAIRGVLKEIAADEGRHSAHGWDVVEWCLAEGGRPVACALFGALRRLPTRLASSPPEAALDGSWERWGIHGVALEREEYAAARAALVTRVQALLDVALRAA